jgi:predicted metal-binding membrane protein
MLKHRLLPERLALVIGLVPLRIPVSLIVLIGAAWALMLHHAIGTSASMGTAGHGSMVVKGMGGVSLFDLGLFLVIWTVMMAAMMLPSAAPMILTFAATQARHDRNVAVPTWMFVAGYILVWTYAGMVIYLLVHAVDDVARHLSWLQNGVGAPLVLGFTLTVAALYQFTPLKRLCLRHCRSPSIFLEHHWRDGWEGAFEMGCRHSLYCVGCCWAFFGVMVAAVGIESITWMLLITLVVFAEKVLPQGPRISVAVALGLITLGLLVAIGAVQPAWLTDAE